MSWGPLALLRALDGGNDEEDATGIEATRMNNGLEGRDSTAEKEVVDEMVDSSDEASDFILCGEDERGRINDA